MNKPTATAVAGKFQSKDGSDLVQYLNSQGQVVLWVDADGVLRINTTPRKAQFYRWACRPLVNNLPFHALAAHSETLYPVAPVGIVDSVPATRRC
jgi:hypothetical protein